jgi:hypothetical protein
MIGLPPSIYFASADVTPRAGLSEHNFARLTRKNLTTAGLGSVQN